MSENLSIQLKAIYRYSFNKFIINLTAAPFAVLQLVDKPIILLTVLLLSNLSITLYSVGWLAILASVIIN